VGRRRWRWLCILGLLAVLLGTKTIQGLAVPTRTPTGKAQVVIQRTGSDINAAVRQAVNQAGGLAGVIQPGDVVVVKVNLVMDAPADSGMVTDPAVARAVVRLAHEAGAAQVFIVESTAQYREGDLNRDRFCTRSAFRNAGYDTDGDMVDDATGAPLVDLNDSGGTDVADPGKVTQVTIPTGLIRKEYWLPNIILNADVLISVPVLKNHYVAGVTLGMKNLIGLLPNDLYHAPGNIYGKHSLSHSPIELDQHIVDLNLARRPDFVVVDGQRGMIDGPIGSKVIDPPMGLILAGYDVVAVDTVGTLVMGYDPRAIPYLQLGAQNGLGIANTGQIQVAGVSLDQVRRNFPAPYDTSPAQRAEAQPPAVAIVAPDDKVWQGMVTVAVEAGDNDAVARVELYLDGQQIGEKLASPYQFELDTHQHPPGEYVVRAVAYDRNLNRSEMERQVHFGAPTASPPPPTDTAQPPPTKAPVPPSTTSVPTEPPTVTESASPSPTATPAPPTITLSPVPKPTGTKSLLASPSTRITSPAPTSAGIARLSEEQIGITTTEPVETASSPYPGWLLPLVSLVFAVLIGAILFLGIGLWISSQRK